MSDIRPATISTLIEFRGETTCNYQINHKLQIQPLRPQNKNIKGKMWRFRCGDWGRQAPESRCVRSTHEDCALAHSHTPFRERPAPWMKRILCQLSAEGKSFFLLLLLIPLVRRCVQLEPKHLYCTPLLTSRHTGAFSFQIAAHTDTQIALHKEAKVVFRVKNK